MSNLLRWYRTGDKVSDVCLQYSSDGMAWMKYSNHPLHQPDTIATASKGFRTAQILLIKGYAYAEYKSDDGATV